MLGALRFFVLLWSLAVMVPIAHASIIGVVLPGSSLVFYQTLLKGIQRSAHDHHVDLLIRSPSDGQSLNTPNLQLRIIDYMVTQGVSGVLLAPEPLARDTRVSVPVPVILVDRYSADYDAISTVYTDNFGAGRKAALSLVPVLKKGAKVAMLRLAPNVSSTVARESGFLSVARKEGWDVVIDTYVGYRPRDAEVLIAEAIKSYPGRLDAVFAPAEPIAYGALRVIETAAIDQRPRLVLFDWRPEFLEGLKKGIVHAAILQDPYRMGYLALASMVEALQGRPPPRTLYVEVATVTPQNMNDPAIRSLIATYAR
ncbi:sugar ABC transporter substrate-binding protein [bacterium M00.F.Ca.ET.228.01.1.1]|uniref:substrate-binding domain-containing protein n=1 Tax=Paraburkholderia phenoliruptrix TaxID=252970 RepID=UPI00109273EB|nr:substrate-binding domain-containing protein [Paraburkholderia phenoliruptrix]TGP39830.1 sugar ABC transporter substrate-binding protein [bacterium M00.F.Ca.ET.228.01.1.1]TGR95691.1 sugar ABC transporter substrate-binding protein [bacterium M00.F.Ca.ET.191.01.1.1]TGT96707.1 sugar ABC transporter substrate-binding protein [bacterium M00.F.Ca.ET.155.01.1.1]MBW0448102.1 substrate-binding domain-containing protein [Paraburkholderia phenoliruptrix]MBW9100209.1 substrate-binding domain-containing 